MVDIVSRLNVTGASLLGTWVKLSTLETMEMLGHAGFDFVVIDSEHGPHTHENIYRLVVMAQAMGMSALVRLPSKFSEDVQRILDAGADGVLLPRVLSPEEALQSTLKLVFSPEGERGLGSTSRAGKWGMAPMADYLEKGRSQTLRMIQLEDLDAIERVEEFCDIAPVNGIFLGLGDLMLSSGLKPSDPRVQKLVEKAFEVTERKGIPCGIATGTAEEGRRYREMGFRMVMVSNDCTLFGRAAASIADEFHGRK